MNNLGHNLGRTGQATILECVRCKNQYSTKSLSKHIQAKEYCQGIPKIDMRITDTPIKVNDTQLFYAGQEVHKTHKIAYYQGNIFCTRCNYYGKKKIINLKRQCKGTADRNARNDLIRLLRTQNVPEEVILINPVCHIRTNYGRT